MAAPWLRAQRANPQVVALTNYHVLHDLEVDNILPNGKNFTDPDFDPPAPPNPNPPKKAIGRTVGQPSDALPSTCCQKLCTDVIGQIYDSILSNQVNSAIATLEPGLRVHNVIPGISAMTASGIVWMTLPPASTPIVVQKRGSKTFFTRGYVSDVNPDTVQDTVKGHKFNHVFSVSACPPFRLFWRFNGDSGAVIADLNNNAVGLLFAGGDPGTAGAGNQHHRRQPDGNCHEAAPDHPDNRIRDHRG